jgi:hypothetical protein
MVLNGRVTRGELIRNYMDGRDSDVLLIFTWLYFVNLIKTWSCYPVFCRRIRNRIVSHYTIKFGSSVILINKQIFHANIRHLRILYSAMITILKRVKPLLSNDLEADNEIIFAARQESFNKQVYADVAG